MMNRPYKYITKVTLAELHALKDMTREARIQACCPANPKGFALYYSYYYSDSINFAHADFHYNVMESLWLIVQGSKKLKDAYRAIGYKQAIQDNFIDELLWIGYRECAKTSMFKAFMTYVITYDLRRYINVDAFDKTNSERILFDIVYNLQTNAKIIADFGHLYTTTRTKDEADQKRITDFITNKVQKEDGSTGGQIRVEAHSTQTPIRGRQHNNDRPDFLWLEDFETEDTITSEIRTESIATHIASFKGGLASIGAWILYSANYLSEYTNVQALIDKSEVSTRMHAYIVPIYQDSLEITWPEKYVMTNNDAIGTRKVSIQSIKERMWTADKGDQSFVMEMLCKPIDYAKQEFKKDMFQHITWEQLRLKRTVLYILIDSGGSSKQTQKRRNGEVDDTGVAYIFVDEYGNWYIKAYGQKMDSKEILELIFSNHVAYKVLETQAIEQTMFTEAIRPFYDQARKDRGQYPKLKLLKAGGRNKENRIRGLIPRYESGTVFHIIGECEQYEEQLLRFPRSKHDDIMDAVAYGNDIIRPPVFEETRQAIDDYEEQDEFSPFAEIGG